MLVRIIGLLSAMLCAGCMPAIAFVLAYNQALELDFNNKPAPDFPNLTVVLRSVSNSEYAQICGGLTDNCVVLNFDTNECQMFYRTTFGEPEGKHRTHEELHCKGYDHTGETTIHDQWTAWKLQLNGGKT